MEILIVEDEWLAVQKLTKLLKGTNQATTIVGVTDGIKSTVEWLNTHSLPHLVLMDIELSDGQCFDIFNLVQVKCPVIFTTSYDECAIKSFRVHHLDYLLKPITAYELEQALNKFQRLSSRLVTSADVGYLVDDLNKREQQPEFKHQFLARHQQRLISVNAVDVAYFFAKEDVTYLFAKDKTNYIVDYTLEALEELLEPKIFFRVNSQFIINARAVSKTHYFLNGKLKLDLKPGTEQEVTVSQDRVNEFKEWIGR